MGPLDKLNLELYNFQLFDIFQARGNAQKAL
jgi:hypothetical protein